VRTLRDFVGWADAGSPTVWARGYFVGLRTSAQPTLGFLHARSARHPRDAVRRAVFDFQTPLSRRATQPGAELPAGGAPGMARISPSAQGRAVGETRSGRVAQGTAIAARHRGRLSLVTFFGGTKKVTRARGGSPHKNQRATAHIPASVTYVSELAQVDALRLSTLRAPGGCAAHISMDGRYLAGSLLRILRPRHTVHP
jgi:hypothetical protein